MTRNQASIEKIINIVEEKGEREKVVVVVYTRIKKIKETISTALQASAARSYNGHCSHLGTSIVLYRRG